MPRTWRLIPAIALLGLAATVFTLGPGASAQSIATRTLRLTELEKGSTYTHVRNTKTKARRSASQGDLIVFTNRVADASGAMVGTIHVDCVTTTGASNFMKSVQTCAGIVVLRDGTLTLQASVSPGVAATSGAITGGTGVYANARGVFVSKEGQHGSQDTITLVD